MKKFKIIIPVVLAAVVIGAALGYFIYGSTLVDITSEKSIIKNLSADPEQPITILKMAKSGEYFAVLYKDPTDTDESRYHFRYITKSGRSTISQTARYKNMFIIFNNIPGLKGGVG